jgi:hypothetical protein
MNMIDGMVIAWLAVVAADIITTAIGVNRGLREATPWLRRLLGEDDLVIFVMGMMLIGIFVSVAIFGLYGWHPWAGYALGVFAIAWRGVVVYRNFKILKGEK